MEQRTVKWSNDAKGFGFISHQDDEIAIRNSKKGIVRFISTHSDDDHLRGLELLDDRITIRISTVLQTTRRRLTKRTASNGTVSCGTQRLHSISVRDVPGNG